MHYGLGQTTHWIQRIEAAVKSTQRISFTTRVDTDTGMMGFVRRQFYQRHLKITQTPPRGDHAGRLQFCEQFQPRISA